MISIATVHQGCTGVVGGEAAVALALPPSKLVAQWPRPGHGDLILNVPAECGFWIATPVAPWRSPGAPVCSYARTPGPFFVFCWRDCHKRR